ncbi:MAG: hypothetical protein EAY65_03565 [Alphaproteobacteria bacterium]|nr:MAG: hypothetical protein EAY65_03565 [Alphaproteobacteria bacterium]
MAGIGFELKKLTNHDNLIGVMHAYLSAGFAAAGPWLFTALALGGITMLYAQNMSVEALIEFRVVLVYNLAASLVLSAPVFMVVTRYIADAIIAKDVTNIPSAMLGCLVVLIAIQIPVAFFFYGYYFELPLAFRLSAIANLFLLTCVWLLGVFLMALKDFKSVNLAYGVGMLVAVFLAHWLRADYGATGMMNGFNVGIMIIVFTLSAKVFAEYPYFYGRPFSYIAMFRPYYQLAVGGVFYNLAIWIDKLIMWFAPQRTLLEPSNLRYYSDYDSAMFLAYITIVPAMALFFFSVETHFFQFYRRFYDDILEHKSLSQIKKSGERLINSVLYHARTFLVLQGAIVFLCVMLAPQLMEAFSYNYRQIGIFRLGVLGGMFHVLALFGMIVLSYFDSRSRVMWLQCFFLVSNAVFTIITLYLGFSFYGYGYFLSSLLTFMLTMAVLFRFMGDLPYHAFVTHNNAIRIQRAIS